jgi:predicted N-acyltransferase
MQTKIIKRISDLERNAWNRLTDYSSPFLDHEFLSALEISGCIGKNSGWLARFICVEGEDGTLLAALPFFLKTHSFGEFIFDFSWAQAFERSGRAYYPKLVCAAPLTPASGSRFLLAPSIGLEPVLPLLMTAANRLAEVEKASSLHILFCQDQEASALIPYGYTHRHASQYHWHNDGYADFNDYLARMNAKHRNQILRERRAIQASGITTQIFTGPDIREEHIESCWQFYQNTHAKHGSPMYLNRAFFINVAQLMPEKLLLVLASRGGKVIAGAFNFIKGKNLYGRYWGCIEEHPFLHFEVCLYQLIEYAIAHRFARFEAGAGGEHKITRGLVPEAVHSAHLMRDVAFHRAISEYIRQESTFVDREISTLTDRLPFKSVPAGEKK